MFLIDTNIFLELFLNREKAEECEKLLERVSKGDLEAIVTRFSIHAIEAILNNPNYILVFLRNIENSLGLTTYDTTIDDEIAVSIVMGEKKMDFDDALQYYVAKKLGAEAIVSFDKHFDNLDIPRKEPKEILSSD
ncbi:MAG: PIN domain-containing protein [Nitrososphaerota archaeon]|nr:PIN domain-containing protein [Nitrososphaerota archaeon]